MVDTGRNPPRSKRKGMESMAKVTFVATGDSFITRHISEDGYDGFENNLNAIDKARIRLDANVNMELALELMFLAMKENS